MLILGIDPGLRHTGFGLIEINLNKIKYIESGIIITDSKKPMNQRLITIFKGITTIKDKYKPDEVCIEKIFSNVNPKTTLLLGQARGVAICAAGMNLETVYEYTALQIKQSIVGYGHANKGQIQYMVKVRLNLNDVPEHNAADALACGLTHIQHSSER